jgi:hypothetical protein
MGYYSYICIINKTTNIMKTLKIKTADFINWYYNSGADQDQEQEALNLGYRIIEGLLDGGITIMPQEILDECNHDIIPLCIVVGYENSDEEIGEVFDDYEVELI